MAHCLGGLTNILMNKYSYWLSLEGLASNTGNVGKMLFIEISGSP